MGEGGAIAPPVEKRGQPWGSGGAGGGWGLPGGGMRLAAGGRGLPALPLRRAQKKGKPNGFLFLLADHFLLAFSFSSRSRSCSAVMA